MADNAEVRRLSDGSRFLTHEEALEEDAAYYASLSAEERLALVEVLRRACGVTRGAPRRMARVYQLIDLKTGEVLASGGARAGKKHVRARSPRRRGR